MLLTYILNGIPLGMVYALVAVGYSMIFGILRLINFSHSAVYTFGAMAVFMFLGMSCNIWVAILLSIMLSGGLTILINKVGFEPLRKKKSLPVATLITTIGISYVISNSLIVLFGSERKAFPSFYDFGSVNIGSLTIDSQQIFLFAISVILLITLTVIVRKTDIGLSMRAVEQNTRAAHLMGINVDNVITFTFFLAGVSASIAGALISGYYQVVYPTMGVMIGNKTFAAAVLGGIGVLHGSMVGGIVVGIIESIAAGYLGGTYRDAASFIILILILIIRPTGLFGKKGISKV